MKILIALILIFISPVCFTQTGNSVEKNGGFESISADEIFNNISFFASDSLKGRATGTDENLIAAMFVAQKFYEYGLSPTNNNSKFSRLKKEMVNENLDVKDAGKYDEYLQKFNLKKSSLSDENYFSINEKRGEADVITNYTFGIDFLLQYNGTNNLKVTTPIVFAGYGISDGPDGYDDYKKIDGSIIDVKNKVVVVIDGYPGEEDPGSSFNKTKSAHYLNPRLKSENAIEKGALAVLLISSPLKAEPPISIKYERISVSFEKEYFHLPELKRKGIPIFYISKECASELFDNTNLNFKNAVENLEKSLQPEPVEIKNKTVSFEINFNNALITTQNVAGFLEGSDPELKDEVIVIGAHYDHVGLGEYSAMYPEQKGKIHNGADDNASGTCGLIELAEAYSKERPKRSILFVAFGAEENGILGSKYYAYVQPIIPLAKTVAMINLDMIGRNEPDLLWIGGAFYSDDVKSIVEQANKDIGFELLYNVGLLNFASDQGPFLKKEIPSIFFFAGLHDDYHAPSDNVEKVDTKKIEKVTKLAYLTGRILSDTKTYPKYRALSTEEKTELVKESLARQRKFRGEPEKSIN
ncbi:MAG: M20/M25/M40 family metallo-hydrolase [Ignavibacteriaceae bacterium]|nr:M20/M25/M40 family metallo-hydrolase [Ignavibacteriaceae bacterium]